MPLLYSGCYSSHRGRAGEGRWASRLRMRMPLSPKMTAACAERSGGASSGYHRGSWRTGGKGRGGSWQGEGRREKGIGEDGVNAWGGVGGFRCFGWLESSAVPGHSTSHTGPHSLLDQSQIRARSGPDQGQIRGGGNFMEGSLLPQVLIAAKRLRCYGRII